ncbi:hypothetical protein GGTG_14128 [Gaeumannomyces tritici R3-111a-1]|uniref:Uncharacterized protein n=1 Tax=Gaeumannomyces tritici (strain R3-111a-1) TaxID=644352 RepID=J3PKR3_GAET3|nr:hypothetical protein GGTG_14128 [Gaeumannomyces tritici R3-111a-1]EJT68295.1 hypothetical protein GGTG_14128 [Gaeumannomyces tritici R3-111a-1]
MAAGNGNTFRLITWALIIPIVLFYVLSLVGCISTSPGVPDIYLLKLNARNGPTEVRVGYFGMCAGTNTTMSSCLPSFSLGRKDAADSGNGNNNNNNIFNTTDPALLRLVDLGHEVQVRVIFFVPLLLASVLFFVSATTVVVWRNVPQVSGAAAAGAFMMHSIALGLLLAAATAVSMVINALHFAVVELTKGQNEIEVTGGSALQAFQWFTVVLSVVWQFCMLRQYRGDASSLKF